MTDWLHVTRGAAPLIVSIPHAGTQIPAAYAAALRDPDAARADTDWHVERLYEFAPELGATLIRTEISRVVIDVNRDPSGASLYPGRVTTELCPTTNFAGEPLYRPGGNPNAEEIAARRARYFEPYHAALDAEIARLRQAYGAIVVYDAHSIASQSPRLFEGVLPLFNIGANGGTSCAPTLTQAIAQHCGDDCVVDGRFRGGWITRRCGAPQQGVHAIQMELAQRAYLDEPSTTWNAPRAAPLQQKLRAILETCITYATSLS